MSRPWAQPAGMSAAVSRAAEAALVTRGTTSSLRSDARGHHHRITNDNELSSLNNTGAGPHSFLGRILGPVQLDSPLSAPISPQWPGGSAPLLLPADLFPVPVLVGRIQFLPAMGAPAVCF